MKIMKKFYLVFLVLGMFVGFLSSCDDDDNDIAVDNNIQSRLFTCRTGDTLL